MPRRGHAQRFAGSLSGVFERKEAEASGPASAFDWCVGKGCRKRWDVARLHGPVGKVSLTPLCNPAGLSPPAVVRATSGSHSRFGLNAASVPMRSEKLSAALFLSQRLSRIGVRNTGTRGAVVRPELQFLQLLPHKTGGLASLTIKGSESWRRVGSRPTREGVLSDATGAIMSVPPLLHRDRTGTDVQVTRPRPASLFRLRAFEPCALKPGGALTLCR
jgi:hypothetical protein